MGFKAKAAELVNKAVSSKPGKAVVDAGSMAKTKAVKAVGKVKNVSARLKGGYKAAAKGVNSNHMVDKVAIAGAKAHKAGQAVKKFAGSKAGKVAGGVAAGAAVAAGGYAAYKAYKNRKAKKDK